MSSFDWNKPLVDNNGQKIVGFRPGSHPSVKYAERADGTTLAVFTDTGCEMGSQTDSKYYRTADYVMYAQENAMEKMTDKELAAEARRLDTEYGKIHNELEKRGYMIYNDQGDDQEFYPIGRISKEVEL